MFELKKWNLDALSRDRSASTLEEVDDLLKAMEEGLSLEGVNKLLNAICSDGFPAIRTKVLAKSSALRQRLFGSAVVPMAPVEVSNYCASNCLFCGWRSSNTAMERVQLSEDLVMTQVEYLLDKGIRYIELVGGDDFNFVRSSLPSLIKKIRDVARKRSIEVKVCFCTMSLTGEHYRELADIGADSMIVWQETYSRECYHEQIRNGPKAKGITGNWKIAQNGDGYSFRLHAQERALEAGLEVAIGTILGLNPNLNFEVMATIAHARYLIENYDITKEHPLIIGMPTWNNITTPETDNRPPMRKNIDPYFSYIAALYLLALPRESTWIFPNCRVGIDEQVESAATAGVFTSTEVKLGPGGYLPAALAEMRKRGASTVDIEKLISFEFNGNIHDTFQLPERLDKQEQFVHYYAPHEDYVRKMSAAGLDVLESPSLP